MSTLLMLLGLVLYIYKLGQVNPRRMNALTSIFTYLPFIYFIVVSVFISFANHVWYHKYRPYTDLTVFILNSVMFFSKNYIIHNMLLFHVWKSILFATYAMAFNSIYTAMFEDFLIDDTLHVILISLSYTIMIWMCHYVLLSPKSMMIVHIIFMYFPMKRNWVINLVGFDSFIIFYIITQFSDVIEYKLNDKTLSWKPLTVSYMYLCINELTMPLLMVHAVLEYYLGKEIKLVETEIDILDAVDKAYNKALKRVRRVRFADNVVTSDEVEQFVENENFNEYNGST